MKYTSRTAYGAVTVQRIEPVDPRIIRAMFSVRIPDYKTVYPEVLFDAYEHLALKGTKQKSDEVIDSFIREHGLMFAVTAGGGYVHFSVSAEEKKLEKAISLIRELLHDTVFAQKHIHETLALMREENREAHDDAKHIADIELSNAFYPKDSHFRLPTLSDERRDIDNITKPQLIAFLKALQRGAWKISVVGSPKAVQLVAPFAEELSRTARPADYAFTHTADEALKSSFVTVPGKSNVEVRIGSRLPIRANDDDYAAFSFGLSVLGKVGGFSGRLMSIVREKEGLTYGIYARIANTSVTTEGHWGVLTFFTARDLARGIESTLREITKIVKGGITERELTVFKEILKNQFVIAHESNARRLRLYHGILVGDETEEDLKRTIEHTAALTRSEVHTALKKYIQPSALTIVGAGPVDTAGKGLL